MALRSRIPEIAAELAPRLAEALDHAAETIADAAKERVPVATGKLQQAIHTERGGGGVYVIAGDGEAWYGMLVEHGTVHNPPHPFLIPAFEEKRDEIQADVAAVLEGL